MRQGSPSALATAGSQHRDLKPKNAFVSKDGDVKILDFGPSTPDGRGHSYTYKRKLSTLHLVEGLR